MATGTDEVWNAMTNDTKKLEYIRAVIDGTREEISVLHKEMKNDLIFLKWITGFSLAFSLAILIKLLL